jgi:hypothetical protein
MLQDFDTEARGGSGKSPRLMAVYGELVNEHLNADRVSDLYVYSHMVLLLFAANENLVFIANSSSRQAWGRSARQLNVMADQVLPTI